MLADRGLRRACDVALGENSTVGRWTHAWLMNTTPSSSLAGRRRCRGENPRSDRSRRLSGGFDSYIGGASRLNSVRLWSRGRATLGAFKAGAAAAAVAAKPSRERPGLTLRSPPGARPPGEF